MPRMPWYILCGTPDALPFAKFHHCLKLRSTWRSVTAAAALLDFLQMKKKQREESHENKEMGCNLDSLSSANKVTPVWVNNNENVKS